MTLKTAKKVLVSAALGVAAVGLMAGSAAAEWKPKGPISLMIGFAAGGGTDTQARLIASELQKRKGWKIIPSNVAGRGGALMARKLKSLPNDGTAIGMAVTESFGYNMLASKNPGYTADDFTYITTTTGSQMGLVVKASKGWKTWDDFLKAARAGTVKFGGMGQKHADVNYLLEQKYGVKFNTVILRGGRAVMNALNAGDIDIGYGAGIQAKAVKSGDMINLVSGIGKRIPYSPNAPTLIELGIPYDIGAKFVVVGPKGMSADARNTLAAAFAEIISDKNSEVNKFITARYTGPDLISGKALDDFIQNGLKESKTLMSVTN